MALDTSQGTAKRKVTNIEYLGFLMVFLAILALIYPQPVAGAFTAAASKVKSIAFDAFLMNVGWAIVCGVIMGRLIERAGFTDALVRIFIPITKRIGINPAVILPSLYHIIGDINAAGRIAGPSVKKAGATKDEQKIAIATMVQSQQSFSTFMLGLVSLTLAKVNPLPIILLTIFLPLIVVPLLLKTTLWRDTKAVSLDELPKFTPDTPLLAVLFGAAREGAEVLFLIVIPAAAAVFSIIGALEYAGIWQVVQTGLSGVLSALSIDVQTGIVSVLAAPTLAMAMLTKTAATMNPKLVVGSFVIAASGFPLGVVFGQIPMIWKGVSDLTETEIVKAAVLGIGMRIITAWLVAEFITPFVMM
ncbi:MAG: hypothetical protein K0Q77_1355 [Anaerosporomusa subterranea]|jgi:hypothetical protein|nr:hypothetical protein [Anaerosporomusa subterranea]